MKAVNKIKYKILQIYFFIKKKYTCKLVINAIKIKYRYNYVIFNTKCIILINFNSLINEIIIS